MDDRRELEMPEAVLLHPAIDKGFQQGADDFAGGTLVCHCLDRPVKVEVKGQIAHNHACGCTQCWKPEGAILSIVAVAPTDHVTVVANADKLAVVNPAATIIRHACTVCGVHMKGPVEKDHAFKGLTFLHPELSREEGWQAPQFGAFISSVIEGGVKPDRMDGIRARLRQLGLRPYDCLSPTLMDALSIFAARKSGVLKD
jgi:S-(hydroxymethyl)glutathione synthase